MSEVKPSNLPETIGLGEMAAAAGKPQESNEAVDKLKFQIDLFFERTPLPQHHRAQAQAKAQELLFWIRAGLTRGV